MTTQTEYMAEIGASSYITELAVTIGIPILIGYFIVKKIRNRKKGT